MVFILNYVFYQPVQPKKPMNKKYNREEILLTGLYLIRRQGYHHTGVSDILKHSGIPKGSFYNFFRSKEDYTLQLMELYGGSIDQLLEQALHEEEPSALRRLLGFYGLLVRAYEQEEARNGCLVMNLATETSGFNDRIAEMAHCIFQGWINQLAVVIAEGQEMEEIRNDESPEVLAEFVHTAFYGSLVRSKMQRSVDPQRETMRLIVDFLRPDKQ